MDNRAFCPFAKSSDAPWSVGETEGRTARVLGRESKWS